MKKLMLSALLMSLLAACASHPTKPEASNAGPTKAPAKAATETKPVAYNPLNDPNNILSHRSVYYDFDKSIVKDEYKPMIKAHSQYLESHASAKVQLQGNCDERGSREYNLALGQRRADSVKQLMEAAGVSGGQISTVSYGSEKPRALGHNEEAWAQNRRTDIVYQSE
ncbi:MAG TPA: peptidoglycan-associated lipoprotein Pal [Burkholderiales bacterium]|nr:peptidoglycan-associated lipoprotein Pal [Burkholderiales bacterium]